MNWNGRTNFDIDRSGGKSRLLHLGTIYAKRQSPGDQRARVVRHKRIPEIGGLAHQLDCCSDTSTLRIFNSQMQLPAVALPEDRQCQQNPNEMEWPSHNKLRNLMISAGYMALSGYKIPPI